jgi:hypothetical protein
MCASSVALWATAAAFQSWRADSMRQQELYPSAFPPWYVRAIMQSPLESLWELWNWSLDRVKDALKSLIRFGGSITRQLWGFLVRSWEFLVKRSGF